MIKVLNVFGLFFLQTYCPRNEDKNAITTALYGVDSVPTLGLSRNSDSSTTLQDLFQQIQEPSAANKTQSFPTLFLGLLLYQECGHVVPRFWVVTTKMNVHVRLFYENKIFSSL